MLFRSDRMLDSVDPELLAVRESMPARSGISVPELAVKCGQSVPRIVGALVELEVLGLVAQDQTGAWRLKRSARAS